MNESKRELIRRDLKANLEEIIFRKLLKKGRVHGYELMSEISREYGILLGPSTVYPFLNGLEEKGYVISKREYPDDGKPKRIYYPVQTKTAERLKEIVSIKNQNRKIMNRLAIESLDIQLPESPSARV